MKEVIHCEYCDNNSDTHDIKECEECGLNLTIGFGYQYAEEWYCKSCFVKILILEDVICEDYYDSWMK